MLSFLKGLLKGFMYVLFLPIGITGICLYMVFGVFVFLYRIGKLIYLFFTGRTLKNELKEDVEVKKLLDNKPEEEEEKDSEPALSLYPSDSEIYKTDYISPTFEQKTDVEEQSSLEEDLTDGE